MSLAGIIAGTSGLYRRMRGAVYDSKEIRLFRRGLKGKQGMPIPAFVWLLLVTLAWIPPAGAAPPDLWIDVRSPEEYNAGHLPGAINIPYKDIATRIKAVAPDPARPLRLYCGIGVRAQMAKFSLESQGYKTVTNEGGFSDLARTRGSTTAPCPEQC